MAIRLEAGSTFAPARSINTLSSPARLGSPLRVSSPSIYGPRLETTSFFNSRQPENNTKVARFNKSDIRTEFRFQRGLKPQAFGARLESTPFFKPQISPERREKFDPRKFRTVVRANVDRKPALNSTPPSPEVRFGSMKSNFRVESGRINYPKPETTTRIKELVLEIREKAKKGRERLRETLVLKRLTRVESQRVETRVMVAKVVEAQAKGRERWNLNVVKAKVRAELKTYQKVEPKPQVDPKTQKVAEVMARVEQIKVMLDSKASESVEIKKKLETKEIEVERVYLQEDRVASQARIRASLEAYKRAQTLADLVDGRLIADLHPSEYNPRTLRSRILRSGNHPDGSYRSYLEGLRSVTSPVKSAGEAVVIFNGLNRANIPVEEVRWVTTSVASFEELRKVYN